MSYDPAVFELGWEFINAGEKYRGLDLDKVPAEEQSEMCGLFKQATFGDIKVPTSGLKGQQMCNLQAWTNCKSLSKVDAIRRYVAKSEQLCSAYGASS